MLDDDVSNIVQRIYPNDLTSCFIDSFYTKSHNQYYPLQNPKKSIATSEKTEVLIVKLEECASIPEWIQANGSNQRRQTASNSAPGNFRLSAAFELLDLA
jgi:hypothetical protein